MNNEALDAALNPSYYPPPAVCGISRQVDAVCGRPPLLVDLGRDQVRRAGHPVQSQRGHGDGRGTEILESIWRPSLSLSENTCIIVRRTYNQNTYFGAVLIQNVIL